MCALVNVYHIIKYMTKNRSKIDYKPWWGNLLSYIDSIRNDIIREITQEI